MRGISEERLKELRNAEFCDVKYPVEGFCSYLIDNECKELQESWRTLEEFLKSGFEGWCWINSDFIEDIAYAYQGVFYWNDQVESPAYDIELITHVQPIHKPEPPR